MPSHLSRRERQIMDAVYAQGECSARDIQAALPDPPSYSSVRALLAILVEKGHLKHRQIGSRYAYSAAQPLSKARDGALKRLVDTFFGGSRIQAVNALLGRDADRLSDGELDELSGLIEQARRRRG